MMSDHRQRVGRIGEKIANRYLRDEGYEILGTNFRTRYGELDIVARSEGIIVFVEVRTRTSERLGTSVDSVTLSKQQQVRRMASIYLSQYCLADSPVRFDVIAIFLQSTQAKLQHIKHAF